jgi:hypothetical protein
MLPNKKWVARYVAYTTVSVLGIVAYLSVLLYTSRTCPVNAYGANGFHQL